MFLLPLIKALFVLEGCIFIFIEVAIEIYLIKDWYRGESSSFMIIMLASGLQMQCTCKGVLFYSA